MSNSASSLLQVFSISVGAVLGSWMRYRAQNWLGNFFSQSYWSTLIINLLATFEFYKQTAKYCD